MKNLSFLLLIFALIACNKEEIEPEILGINNPMTDEINFYVQDFVREAELHNVEVDVSDLSIGHTTFYLKLNNSSQNYCGLGYQNYEQTGKPRIEISKKCWEPHSLIIDGKKRTIIRNFSNERLVFHELGHAILKRSHDNTLLPNGDYKTLMNSSGYQVYDKDDEKRAYYIAELFNPHEPVPEWATFYLENERVFYLFDSMDELSDTWTPNDTVNFTFFRDTVNYISPPAALSIEPDTSSQFLSARYSRTIINEFSSDSLYVTFKVKAIGDEKNTKSPILRMHFTKGEKHWNISKKFMEHITMNGSIYKLEDNTGFIKPFDELKVVLEFESTGGTRITFDDFELTFFNQKKKAYPEN